MLTIDFGCGLQKIEQFWYVRIDTLGIKTYMQCSMKLNDRNKSEWENQRPIHTCILQVIIVIYNWLLLKQYVYKS
jgi:hypothetical protein